MTAVFATWQVKMNNLQMDCIYICTIMYNHDLIYKIYCSVVRRKLNYDHK